MKPRNRPENLRQLFNFRYLFVTVAIAMAGSAVGAACSSSGGARTAGGSGGETSTGTSIGPGSGGSISVTGGGGAGGGDPALVSCDPVSKPCPTGQVCVKGAMGGVCSPNGGPCNPADDKCQNDQYCCGAGCRLDGMDPICVSGGTRPVNGSCKAGLVVGLFSPNLQCQWPQTPGDQPLPGDPYPNHKQVLVTPLVADMPTRPAGASWSNIIIVASDSAGGAAAGDGTGGRIRILNGQTCAQEAVINTGPAVRDAATPAIADLDNDGTMEIVARENFPNNNKIVAFKFSGGSFKVMWEATGAPSADLGAWDGVSIHDITNDGFPEVIARYGEVYDGRTGNKLSPGGGPVILESDPVLGDVDHDGTVELIANKVFSWNGTGWTEKYKGLNASTRQQAVAFYGFADFGTRSPSGAFDPTKKDGRAEIVAVGAHLGTNGIDEQTGVAAIYTLEGEPLLNVTFPAGPTCRTGQSTGERGGPPTIGDFDGDGMPELATAGAYAYRVFDLGATTPNHVLWSQPSQDCSSGATGSTIFDFEGDGRAEAIYADECFVRVYDGKTGEVLFSQARTSATWWEQNIVADPDHSDRSKIIFNNAAEAYAFSNCNGGVPDRTPSIATNAAFNGMVDKIYKGLRCATNEDCPSANCNMGYCRCTVHTSGPPDIECGNDFDPPLTDGNAAESGFVCTSPLPGTPGTGNVCRMQHGNVTTKIVGDRYFDGIRVYRDKLDRWASSRAMWNQHVYSVTNINDDGKVPKTSDWMQNFLDPKLNNFRQNRQGATSQDLADITGSLDPADACQLTQDGKVVFKGRICNRGLRGVAANMPATFYLGGGDGGALGMPVCMPSPVFTTAPVPMGGCAPITCTAPLASVPPNATITMVVNDSGGGMRLTDECNYVNNTSSVVVPACNPPPR